MQRLGLILSATLLVAPLLAVPAVADNETASQISAAGHGRRPILTNRPSREIYHRNRDHRPFHVPHRHRHGY